MSGLRSGYRSRFVVLEENGFVDASCGSRCVTVAVMSAVVTRRILLTGLLPPGTGSSRSSVAASFKSTRYRTVSVNACWYSGVAGSTFQTMLGKRCLGGAASRSPSESLTAAMACLSAKGFVAIRPSGTTRVRFGTQRRLSHGDGSDPHPRCGVDRRLFHPFSVHAEHVPVEVPVP